MRKTLITAVACMALVGIMPTVGMAQAQSSATTVSKPGSIQINKLIREEDVISGLAANGQVNFILTSPLTLMTAMKYAFHWLMRTAKA